MPLAKRRIGTQKTPKAPKAKAIKTTIYRLMIKLTDAPLPIWRRVLVNADLPLDLFHEVLQITMGWWDSHIHAFETQKGRFGMVEDTPMPGDLEDESLHILKEFLKKAGDQFIYRYDFGDDWVHAIVVEEVLQSTTPFIVTCIGGKRACPPEDVGGVPGYQHFLEIIEDPLHPERVDMFEWCGGDFDADAFDLRGVNLRLIQLEEALLEVEPELNLGPGLQAEILKILAPKAPTSKGKKNEDE